MIGYEQEDAFVAEKRKERIDYSTICRSRNQMDLTKEQLEEAGDEFRLVRGRYPFIQSVSLTEDGWNLALHIAEKSNIFAPDAIHLAAAWQCKSNILLTADDHFKKIRQYRSGGQRPGRRVENLQPRQRRECAGGHGVRGVK